MEKTKKYLFAAIASIALLAAHMLLATGADGAEANAQERHLQTLVNQGHERRYWVLAPDNPRAIVVMLHGYGGKAQGYRPEMDSLALAERFVLCVPQALRDTTGKTGWNVGYPFQGDFHVDDVRFLRALVTRLCRRYKVPRRNVFCTGMSNGGEMCYLLAYRAPRLFTALAPIAGLTLCWMPEKYKPRKAVPLMEVHGTADKTSRWTGDLENKYGWGAYLPVPEAVEIWARKAGCPESADIELKSRDSKRIILHSYNDPDSDMEVRLYEIQGGTHSWALGSMDTCKEVWEFFKIYLK